MPPTNVHSIPGLKNLFNGCSAEVQTHFTHLPTLLEDYPLEVALGYVFHRLELGQKRALYCGVVRFHRADSTVAANAMDAHHMTRKGFEDLYRIVFEVDLPQAATQELRTAERTRDRIMHGGDESDDQMRNAIARVLDFAEAVNTQLMGHLEFQPFKGNWKGFAGALQTLDTRTTRFMLKGMGFALG